MKHINQLRGLLGLLLVVALVPVAHAQDAQVTRMRAALAAPDRPADNKARDADRKPIESVQFFGIKTGDTVVDMVAAGGWFTEVLSAAVGPTGNVYSQNPPFLVQADAGFRKLHMHGLGIAQSRQQRLLGIGLYEERGMPRRRCWRDW